LSTMEKKKNQVITSQQQALNLSNPSHQRPGQLLKQSNERQALLSAQCDERR